MFGWNGYENSDDDHKYNHKSRMLYSMILSKLVSLSVEEIKIKI